MRTLTPGEKAYVLDAALGLTAAQSAAKHSVSLNTVNSMLKRAKAALNAKSIAHAVALCMAYGEFTREDIFERKG